MTLNIEGNRAHLLNSAYQPIMDSLPSRQAELKSLQPDQQLDVIEQLYSLYFGALYDAGYCCAASTASKNMLKWLDKISGASPTRVFAFKATVSYMEGRAGMSKKHKQFSCAVQHFKVAVKLGKKAASSPAAVPGLMQLCWTRSAECFYLTSNGETKCMHARVYERVRVAWMIRGW